MKNPDKYIRKYFYDELDGKTVDGNEITVHDFNYPEGGEHYILIGTQSKNRNRDTKCEVKSWDCTVTLDIVTVYDNNAGSRELADDIMEMVMTNIGEISITGFETAQLEMNHLRDIFMTQSTQTIIRKIIEYEVKMTET